MHPISLALLAALSPQTEPPCTASVKTHGEAPALIDVLVGYGMNGYNKSDLLVPEPIPVVVEFDDKDKLLVLCGLNCEINESFDSGPLTLNWSLTWGGR
ncbi:MAG: hypothetical protein ABL998_10645 [Planctomycetota bacterium]